MEMLTLMFVHQAKQRQRSSEDRNQRVYVYMYGAYGGIRHRGEALVAGFPPCFERKITRTRAVVPVEQQQRFSSLLF